MQILSASVEEKSSALRRNRYFSSLDEGALLALAQGAQLRRYEPGEAVCWHGEPCAGLYILRRGRVKLFKLSAKGRELIIEIFQAGTTFNEVPVFDGGLNVVNVAALEESEIWLIEKEGILQALRAHPEMAQAVILNLSQNLRMLIGKVEELSFYQVTHRLARLINQLPDEEHGHYKQRVTQDQMAARLGTVREVVARSLRQLEGSGAIRVRRQHIQVLNENLLRLWSQEVEM